MKRKINEQLRLKKKLEKDPYVNIFYKDDMWFDNPSEYRYVQYWNNRTGKNNISTWYKKHSNRKIRNYKKDLSNGCEYKKILDSWIWD